MRAAVVAAGLAVVLAGCETFEPYSIDYDEIINESGVSVYANLMEDFGSRWYQFSASNSNSFSVCAQTYLHEGASTSGHSMGGVFRIGPGETIDIGYVTLPASFNTGTQVWDVEPNGECGSPPG